MKILLLKFFDRWFGTALAHLLRRPKFSPFCPPDPQSFLIIRPGGIGDAILLAASVAALHRRFPAAAIDVLAELRNAGAFALIPGLREIYLYDRPTGLVAVLRRRYDVVIDTEQWHRLSAVVGRVVRSKMKIGFATNQRVRLFTNPVGYDLDRYEAESFLDLLAPLGICAQGQAPLNALVIPAIARNHAAELLRPAGEMPLLVLFAGASIPEKRWAAANFRAVIDGCLGAGLAVVMVGSAADAESNAEIAAGRPVLNLAGQTSLAETAAIINQAVCVVSGDSGVLHIAAALGCPTVALFGPSSVAKWAPRGEQHVALIKTDCSPCSRYGNTPECLYGGRCMSEITVSDVTVAIFRLLDLPADQG